MDATMELPTGTVTFLFTDIEGSTRHWAQQPEEMHQAVTQRDALLRAAIGAHQGDIREVFIEDRAPSTPAPANPAPSTAVKARPSQEWRPSTGNLDSRAGVGPEQDGRRGMR